MKSGYATSLRSSFVNLFCVRSNTVRDVRNPKGKKNVMDLNLLC